MGNSCSGEDVLDLLAAGLSFAEFLVEIWALEKEDVEGTLRFVSCKVDYRMVVT